MSIVGTLPKTLANGTVIDANPVMEDLQFIADQVNANALGPSTLSPPGGAALIGYQPLGGGAATTVADSLRRYYVDGDSFISPSYTRAQNNTGWATMVTYIATLTGGAHVQVSQGEFLFQSAIAQPVNTIITGQGGGNTTFSFNHVGNGVESINTINSSATVIDTIFEHIHLKNTNASTAGGGYYDLGGVLVQVRHCKFTGWKYHNIFDQTNAGDIFRCVFSTTLAASGSAQVWLVNGADYTPGALPRFTNEITIRECIFSPTHVGVADDGGTAHIIKDNIFSGGVNAIRTAGSYPLSVTGNKFGGQSGSPISLETTSSVLGTSVGGNSIYLANNSLSSTVPVPAVKVNAGAAAQFIASTSNSYDGAGSKITPITGIGQLTSIGDLLLNGTLTDNLNDANVFYSSDQGSFTPSLAFGGGAVGITYSIQQGRYQKLGSTVSFTIHIRLTSAGSSVGSAFINNLPYRNNSSMRQSVSINQVLGVSGVTSMAGYIDAGDNNITLINGNVNSTTNLNDTNISNTGIFLIAGTYMVA